MKIDGKKIAEDLRVKLQAKMSGQGKKLVILLVGNDKASAQFVERKKKIGESLGVEVVVYDLEDNLETSDLIEMIVRLNNDQGVDGIIVQLPLPISIETEKVLSAISPQKDVDALTKEARVDSPVVGAVRAILTEANFILENKKIIVLGQGRLVGRPVALALAGEGYDVTVLDDRVLNIEPVLKQADLIISGIGRGHWIKPAMLKKGVVLIDIGTSEQEGSIVGDVDPACYDLALAYTPVPGGVGPIVVIKLFENLWQLSQ